MSSATLQTPFVAGFVAVLGLPNSGKSTLVNRLLGEKVSIVSPKAQTTRQRIHGILNRPRAQVVLVDTPGFCRERGLLQRTMRRSASAALASADVNLVVVDVSQEATCSAAGHIVLQAAQQQAQQAQTTLLVALNKMDLLPSKAHLLPSIAHYSQAYQPQAVLPICARSGDGLVPLTKLLEQHLPAGPALFPTDLHTDQAERFICAELIREQLLYKTHAEVPHTCVVTIEAFVDERPPQGGAGHAATRQGNVGHCYLEARIYVERDSQKGIVIGARGQQIKAIGSAARQRIAQLLGSTVELRLSVHVDANWTQREAAIRAYGLHQEARAC